PALVDIAEVAEAEGLAEAIVQLTADGQALVQAGQRLVVPSMPVVACAEVVVGLSLGGQVAHSAGDSEGILVYLEPVPLMAVHPEEPDRRLAELHPGFGGPARGGCGLPHCRQQTGPFSLEVPRSSPATPCRWADAPTPSSPRRG